jgi:hypothetical protein
MISLPCLCCLLSCSGTLMYSCKMKCKASLRMEISTFTTWRKTGLLTDLDYENFVKVEEWQGDKRFTEDTVTKSWSLCNWQSVDKVSFKAKVDKKHTTRKHRQHGCLDSCIMFTKKNSTRSNEMLCKNEGVYKYFLTMEKQYVYKFSYASHKSSMASWQK